MFVHVPVSTFTTFPFVSCKAPECVHTCGCLFCRHTLGDVLNEPTGTFSTSTYKPHNTQQTRQHALLNTGVCGSQVATTLKETNDIPLSYWTGMLWLVCCMLRCVVVMEEYVLFLLYIVLLWHVLVLFCGCVWYGVCFFRGMVCLFVVVCYGFCACLRFFESGIGVECLRSCVCVFFCVLPSVCFSAKV